MDAQHLVIIWHCLSGSGADRLEILRGSALRLRSRESLVNGLGAIRRQLRGGGLKSPPGGYPECLLAGRNF
jgi:hypothetical protein